ncbi:MULTISPECIES: aspartate aminotransferase family protein [Mesorhizobium]|uniref:4-aminobutyrate aminotransferase n=2 Tax=Mesorhizobium TaxID=68287 RepID=A0A1A5JJU3_RHILI|nr:MULTISPECIES: aspartate aminotransferase family protein [Mesorhizobium]OBP71183.1 4-aminobutyrate aminotransferase [Mesorhizobium loti]OBP77434.1 4-aminobutyrate aminotransferase [Mesorhizobium loti]OBP81475.1 4-aminobutyrate aminotransferase [Mesorhizobium loti]OBP90173.1 4-aminobutyrate aminotransferase [Mesorhizobium loti]OBP91436.1 4-aminobutyrate aminotransferase [Mesorhizobium loti]
MHVSQSSPYQANADSTASEQALLERRARLLGPTYRAFYRNPIHLVRGSGVWLYDATGRKFLDAYNNVASVGHCHPRVVEALSGQAATLNTHTRYLSEIILDYAEKLLGTVPSHLGHAMFTCTGSEANDLAIRIAQHSSGGTGVIITDFAYHGATIATAQLSPAAVGAKGVPVHHRTVAAPDTFRDHGRAAKDFAKNVAAAIEDMRAQNIRPAALLLDSAFSSDGIFFPDAAVMREAGDHVRKAGGIVIADEVQSGFGRLGQGMWGFANYGLEPDIVTMGKPIGDGHPMGAVLVRPRLVSSFGSNTGYFNTFGGNPVAAAVGIAVLDVIEGEGLIENARNVGAYTADLLRALQGRHGMVGDVRHNGLYFGVELTADGGEALAASKTSSVVEAMREDGVLISSCGPRGNVLKIRPPLPFARDNAEQLAETLDRALSNW